MDNKPWNMDINSRCTKLIGHRFVNTPPSKILKNVIPPHSSGSEWVELCSSWVVAYRTFALPEMDSHMWGSVLENALTPKILPT